MHRLEQRLLHRVVSIALIVLLVQSVLLLTYFLSPTVRSFGGCLPVKLIPPVWIGLVVLTGLIGVWMMRRGAQKSWRKIDPALDFHGEWKVIGRIDRTLAPAPSNADGEDDVSTPAAARMFEGIVQIDQSPLGIVVRAAWSYAGDGDAPDRRLRSWRSTAARLSESGEELTVCYEVRGSFNDRVADDFGRFGVEEILVEHRAAGMRTKPVQLVGAFRDCARSSETLCVGSMTYHRLLNVDHKGRKTYHGLPRE